MRVYAVTQKGSKTENEDRTVVGNTVISSGVLCEDLVGGILAVADGVGGNNAGAVASEFVAGKLCETAHISTEFFGEVNNELIKRSLENDELRGMATTLSGILISDDGATLFSVGNTRVYLLQGGKYLKQLTTDDTTLQFLLSTGQLSHAESETFERKNEITACFGGGNPKYLDIKISIIGRICCPIMITSDGLHDYLSTDRIEEIIAENEMPDALHVLINEARQNGSHDDISIVFGEN